MIIRSYTAADMPAIRDLHRGQALDYALPNFNEVTYPIRLVLERDGKVVQAAFAHLTAEVYFLIDKNAGTPQERWDWFQALHRRGLELAYYPGGLDNLHAFLAPQVEKAFGRRLKRLGWSKALWQCYSIGVDHG